MNNTHENPDSVSRERSVMEVFDPPLPRPIKFSVVTLGIALLGVAAFLGAKVIEILIHL